MTNNTKKIFSFSNGSTIFAWLKILGVIGVIVYVTFQIVAGNLNVTNENQKSTQQNARAIQGVQAQLVTDIQAINSKLNVINIKLERNNVQLEHLLRINKLK